MDKPRHLIVVADDFGIGPETSRGILELAARGVVTGTVLLVNSPYAQAAVGHWRQAGRPLDLGWHPCLTLDQPVAPPKYVPSLVDGGGNFFPLGKFLARLMRGLVRRSDLETELRAQLERFLDIVGSPPTLVNSHQHVSLFPPVGEVIRQVLSEVGLKPYFRRVREPWSMLGRIPGARKKRLLLSLLGEWEAWQLERQEFPGQNWLAGITDPVWVRDPEFFSRWLRAIPGTDVELACHPGHHDTTLLGRDAHPGDGLVQRRIDEGHLLGQDSFLVACKEAGFTLVSPRQWLARNGGGCRHAA